MFKPKYTKRQSLDLEVKKIPRLVPMFTRKTSPKLQRVMPVMTQKSFIKDMITLKSKHSAMAIAEGRKSVDYEMS